MIHCGDVTRTACFTACKNEQTVQYFLKTYDTYAFMANFVAWFGGERSVDSM